MRIFFLFVLPCIGAGIAVIGSPQHWLYGLPIGALIGFIFGWVMWLLGSVYNPIAGRRESLFD